MESPDFTDPRYNIPVFSLYGEVRRPSGQMMQPWDVMLFDLQDLGCRIYTFITTLLYVLEEAAKHNKSVWVLDAIGLRANALAHIVGHFRHVGKPLQQRLEIQPRPARENRQPALRPQRRQRPPCIGDPVPGRIVHGRIDMAEQRVRNLLLLLRRRPRGDDAQIRINLHGIGVDDRPSSRCASAIATADLPLAVGPAMRIASTKDSLPPPPVAAARRMTRGQIYRNPRRCTRQRAAGSGPDDQGCRHAVGRRPRMARSGMAADIAFDGPAAPTRTTGRPCTQSPIVCAISSQKIVSMSSSSRREPAQETVPRRHGLHHDRPGMYR